MSRVGKYPVTIPADVEVAVVNDILTAKGKHGALSLPILTDEVTVSIDDGAVSVVPVKETKKARMLWGTTRANIANMVKGVSEKWEKTLDIVGVGYRAALKGTDLELSLGFSHPVHYKAPEGIEFKVPQPTQVVISGVDKQVVGQVASEIRGYRPPEPYKGKGVKYGDETILRKEGKKK